MTHQKRLTPIPLPRSRVIYDKWIDIEAQKIDAVGGMLIPTIENYMLVKLFEQYTVLASKQYALYYKWLEEQLLRKRWTTKEANSITIQENALLLKERFYWQRVAALRNELIKRGLYNELGGFTD